MLIEKLRRFYTLFRFHRLVGFWLLFYPCLWGIILSLGKESEKTNNQILKNIIIFALGAFLLRTAGCVINDIFDSTLDCCVERTKGRPLAQRKISLSLAWLFFFLFSGAALGVWLQLTFLAKAVSLMAFILGCLYPLMKRVTYWPQLYLGIIFNSGLIISWLQMNYHIPLKVLSFYMGCVFWTLGYDTVYAAQDIEGDQEWGTKSTALLFKDHLILMVCFCYSLMVFFLVLSGVFSFLSCGCLLFLILFFLNGWLGNFDHDLFFKNNSALGALITFLLIFEYLY